MINRALAGAALVVALAACGDAEPAPPASSVPFQEIVIDAAAAGDCKMAGDLDGDGFADLVLGGGTSEKLVWYRYPRFEKSVIATPATEFTTDGALGDLDGDGDLDVIVPDGPGAGNLLWFENPSWKRHVVGSVGDWGKDVEIADFDGNGRLDVAVRSRKAAMIFHQSAGGVWARSALQVASLGNEGMASGDVDGDGDPDLVFCGAWLENAGGAWREHRIGAAPGAFKACLADLDGDGAPEVVYSDSEDTADVTAWTAADPRGDWTAQVVLAAVERCHTLQAGDMDGDGDADLVVGQMHTAKKKELMVLLNEGGGSGWVRGVLSRDGVHNGVVVDIGNDGDLDIFGANWTGNPPVRLWLNRTDPKFPAPRAWRHIEVTAEHERTFGLAFGDVDRDGAADIVSGRYWYRNPGGDLTAGWRQSKPFPRAIQAMLVMDIDGDAECDIIGQKAEGDVLALYWIESGAVARVGAVPATSHGEGAQGYGTAQIERDGGEEIVVSSGGGLYYFRRAGDGWQRVHVHGNPSDEGFGVGDLDGDGDLDLVAGTGESKRVEWYENPGDGSAGWKAHRIARVPGFVYPDRFAVADLDGDGRLDVVGTEENGADSDAETVWWSAPKDPTQPDWPARPLTSQASTNAMSVADLNGDGVADIITGEHRGQKRLTLWINDGFGRFHAIVADRGKESHLGARSFDLDGDGDLELISIAWDDPRKIHLWQEYGAR